MSIKNILIVEDDIILSMLNRRIVELLGHKVVKVIKSGEEAIDFAINNDIDVILMDIRLKGKIDGIDALIEINKFKPLPAIYVTGNSDEETRSRAEKTNMLAFCIKPFSYEELEQIIGKAN
jgi:DNA-binding NtrC family response regulator